MQVLFTEIIWIKDGEIISDLNNQDIVHSSRTEKGEVWFAEVRVSDGITWSTWERGGNYTIVNSPPDILEIIIIPVKINSCLKLKPREVN